MIKIFRYSIYTFFIPFWLVQLLISRNKNIWIFGAWYGHKYSDNAKTLFEFTNKNDPSIKVIWLTRDKKIEHELKMKGFECYQIWSIKGILYSLKAGNVIFSSGKMDINQFFINGARTYQLWHGAPMKKIGLDDKFSINKLTVILKRKIFPFLFEYNTDYVVSTSDIFNEKLSSAFNVVKERILSSGYPRNDIFFDKNYTHPLIQKWDYEFNSPLKIIYLPTFRNLAGNVDLFSRFDYDGESMEKLLNRINGIFITKGHFIDNKFTFEKEYSRIINLTNDLVPEINPLLKDIDILLTDYSGAYFDFLLTEKPIIFTCFDFTEYVNNNRELYFEYDKIIAGPKTNNWMEVENEIMNIIEKDKYIQIRGEMNKLFNQYNRGNSTFQIHSIIKNQSNYSQIKHKWN